MQCGFTAAYKGCFIHQLTDGSFSWQSNDHQVRPARSWRAAQIAITRFLRSPPTIRAS